MAQDGRGNEVSLNITETIMRFSRQPFTTDLFESPFLFGIKIPLTNINTNFFRLGLNANFNNEKAGSGMNKKDLSSHFLNINMGIEKRVSLNSRFSCFYGIELFFIDFNETSKLNPGLSKSKLVNQKNFVGVSPLFGFNFNINDRVKIFTESYVRIAYQKDFVFITNTGNPNAEPTFITKMEGSAIRMIIPSQIHISFRL
jgi:hypothetical protein